MDGFARINHLPVVVGNLPGVGHGGTQWQLNGGLERPSIGHYSLHDEATALEAVRAAARAYDRGRGAWPTMTVAARIERVQDFALRIKGQREPVVRLMMWEIGKSPADARREFDRTI
jgi:glyceraldehyde-3-phosphate dehydrogenase (NADP+)